jgi:hypothetical protein
MNILQPYYVLKESRQAVKHLKINILLKKPAQNNATKTSDKPVPIT